MKEMPTLLSQSQRAIVEDTQTLFNLQQCPKSKMKMIKLRLLLRVLLNCVYVVSRNFLTAVMDTENLTASKRRITSPDGDTIAVRKKSCSSASSPSCGAITRQKCNLATN